jgi:hypothetical protein
MLPQWFMPAISIALNIGSALVYFSHGDLNRTTYWLAAAVLTTTVTMRN